MDNTLERNIIKIRERIGESRDLKSRLMEDEQMAIKMGQAAEMIVECLQGGGKVHFCGNGGSAADAQHLAAELSGRYYFDRKPLNAEALHCNTSYLTAVANDYGYEKVYERLLQGTAKDGDILIGISTSGNSTNIVNAYEYAKEHGIRIISMTGASGGKMGTYEGILLNVPSSDTPRIQECHIMIGHIICEIVEATLFQ